MFWPPFLVLLDIFLQIMVKSKVKLFFSRKIQCTGRVAYHPHYFSFFSQHFALKSGFIWIRSHFFVYSPNYFWLLLSNFSGEFIDTSYGFFYLVRDINSPIYFHQSTNIFSTKFGVMVILLMLTCILMPPQNLEKTRLFQSRKIINKIKLMSWTRYSSGPASSKLRWWISFSVLLEIICLLVYKRLWIWMWKV